MGIEVLKVKAPNIGYPETVVRGDTKAVISPISVSTARCILGKMRNKLMQSLVKLLRMAEKR